MKRALLLSALLFSTSLAACDGMWFGDGDGEKKPLTGTRISVLDYERDLRPDENADASSPLSTPQMWQNDTWPQAGGYPGHDMQNLALSTGALKKLWSTDIGEGSRSNLPLTAQPVAVGKSIFALDTDSKISAFNIDNGDRRWTTDIRDPEEEDPVIGGGIAVSDGFVYATGGYDELLCLDAEKGAIKWRTKLSSPSRAAPTTAGGRVFVTTLNNTIMAIDAASGTVLWEFAGLGQNAGLVGAASPAATNDMVLPAFTSGEIYALRSNNGSVAWSDNLSSAVRLGGMTGLSDIRGLPVVSDNMVYAISFGGKMAAIDLRTGSRVWQKDIAGAKTPWVSGNRVYIISSDAQMVSLDKDKGTVLWVSQLARFKNKEDRKGSIFWTGPVMAGNRLFAVSSDGRIAEVDPGKGSLIREWGNGEPMAISPLVVNGTLYVLTEEGSLIAYR